MKIQPLVTVGVASFNNATYLRETLESIRNQTYPNVEVVIVDDASTDNSVAVARQWLTDYPAVRGRLIEHPVNRGVCRVCNEVVAAASGEFICIIGSDDIYLPDKLALQVPLLLAAPPEVGVITSRATFIDAHGAPRVTPPGFAPPHPRRVFVELLEVNFIAAMTTLVRRACFVNVGPYDERLIVEDWDMWLRLAREYEFLYTPEVTALYRIHDKSVMQSRQRQVMESAVALLYKQWGVNEAGNHIIIKHIDQLSEKLYQLGSPQARHWLRVRYQLKKDPASLVLLLAAAVGLPQQVLTKSQTLLNRLRRPAGAAS